MNHPYIGGGGAIIQAINHLRRSFPASVSADTLKKLGIASKNESYLINILRFLSVIDDEGKRTAQAAKVFNLHDDAEFQKAFGQMVKAAYVDLFALHGDSTWTLDLNALITFFRQTDQSSGIVGGRQANTFRTLAALSGHGEAPVPKLRTSSATGKGTRKPATKSTKKVTTQPTVQLAGGATAAADSGSSPFGLTVRIEINLPADASQDAYDKIFQSVRKNLIDGR
jgi:hypothetical protein